MGDGSANAYLAVAGVLFAGLHGLRESLPLQPPVAGAVTADTRDQPLAHSLEASLAALERDSLLRGLFAPKLVDTFVAVKRFELERHRAWVSDWEVEEYLRHL
jgi:glutamine synthetase